MQPDHTLLIDIGNTRLKGCALADADGSAVGVTALAHAEAGFVASLRAWIGATPWQSIWIANVGPRHVLSLVEEICAAVWPRASVQHARSLAQCAGLLNGYDEPAQLGVDRFLALLAARERWPRDRVLLVSVGSAVTIDLLGEDGTHAGGLIAPSPRSMRSTLAGLSSRLALHAEADSGTFASDTANGIANGCTLAISALIEHCARVAGTADSPPTLVLTGGDAAHLAPRIGMQSQVIPYLVLAGLRRYVRHSFPDEQSAIDR